MHRPLLTFTRFATPAFVVAVGGFVLPAAAGAKVTCEASAERNVTGLPGLPEKPTAGQRYALTVDLPRKHTGNPSPLLLAQRCEHEGSRQLLDTSVQFRGTAASEGGDTFTVRFPHAGLWHVVSMDVSGFFRDHGFYEVSPASTTAPSEETTVPRSVLIGAGGIAGLTGLVFAFGHRRRRNDRT